MGAPWRGSAGWWVVERASEVLDEDLAGLLLDDDEARLARTRDAQLAVLLTSLVAWESGPAAADDPVVAMAGHSLGQVTALVASGALALEDGVRLAARRAELTQAAADAVPSRMVALLGASLEQAGDACAAAPDECWLANDNAPGQVVIAGTADGTDAAVARAGTIGVRKSVALQVGGAFHTPLMAPARDDFAAALAATPFASPRVAVVANGDAAPHTDGDGWRERLADHLVSPVRWRETQLRLVAMGASAFVEVGGPGTLSAMAKRTVPGTSCRLVDQPIGAPSA